MASFLLLIGMTNHKAKKMFFSSGVGLDTKTNFNRAHLYAFVLAFGGLNALFKPALNSVHEVGFFSTMIMGFGSGFIVPVAFATGLYLTWKAEQPPIAKIDWLIVLVCLVGLQIPSSTIAWLTTSTLAMIALRRFQNPWIKSGLSLIIFVSLRGPLTAALLKIFAEPLLEFDAALTGFLLNLFTEQASNVGNVVIGANGHRLLILTGCTSYTNLSLALLISFTLFRFFNPLIDKQQIITWAIIAFAVVGLNTLRLAFMAVDADFYYFFHDGAGASIFQGFLYGLTICLSLKGVRHVQSR